MTSTRSTSSSKTAHLVLCGLFAAINAVCSFITIPLGFTPVPLNLGTLAVFLTGGILGAKYGAISESVYVLIGIAGIPVFSGLRGGISVLAGPTGGYIPGYVAAAFIIGTMLDHWYSSGILTSKTGNLKTYSILALAMIAGLISCYFTGTIWFIISTGTGLWASLVSCVLPFLAGDALKISAAVLLIGKLRPILR